MPGVEYKTYGRIAPVGQEHEEKQQKTRKKDQNQPQMSNFQKSWVKIGSIPKLKPTGC